VHGKKGDKRPAGVRDIHGFDVKKEAAFRAASSAIVEVYLPYQP
jgi:hypothetical protein